MQRARNLGVLSPSHHRSKKSVDCKKSPARGRTGAGLKARALWEDYPLVSL